MERSSEYLGLLVAFIASAGVACLVILLNAWLGPKNKSTPVKSEPFECGMDPIAIPGGHFSVKFYLIAMFFILFDVEIVWLFPWAVILKSLGWAGIAEFGGHQAEFFQVGGRYFSHSKAPFFHAYTKPSTITKIKANISTIPGQPRLFKMTAQGKSQTISTSNRMKNMAMR